MLSALFHIETFYDHLYRFLPAPPPPRTHGSVGLQVISAAISLIGVGAAGWFYVACSARPVAAAEAGVLTVLTLVTLWLGTYPGPLIDLIERMSAWRF